MSFFLHRGACSLGRGSSALCVLLPVLLMACALVLVPSVLKAGEQKQDKDSHGKQEGDESDNDSSDEPGIYPGANISFTMGASWGDSGYRTPLSGELSMGVRAEFNMARQEAGWGIGIYGEITDPGSFRDSRWAYGGGLLVVSPEIFLLSASWSMGVFSRPALDGELSGLTTGLAIGFRPRQCPWDFILAARVDLRSAVGTDEDVVTVGVQIDALALFYVFVLAVSNASIY